MDINQRVTKSGNIFNAMILFRKARDPKENESFKENRPLIVKVVNNGQ